MDSRLKFRPRHVASNHRGTLERSASGFVDGRLKVKGATPRPHDEGVASANPSRVESTGEKSFVGSCVVSVP